MVVLPERLLKGPLVAKQKTKDPPRGRWESHFHFPTSFQLSLTFPGCCCLVHQGQQRVAMKQESLWASVLFLMKDLLFSGITTVGKEKPTVNCILLKGPKEVWQVNERWQAAPELLEVLPHTNYGPTQNGRKCAPHCQNV